MSARHKKFRRFWTHIRNNKTEGLKRYSLKRLENEHKYISLNYNKYKISRAGIREEDLSMLNNEIAYRILLEQHEKCQSKK